MPIYDRQSPSNCEIVDGYEAGTGWVAHPKEVGRRMSHAVVGENDGVCLIDPIDAPGIDKELSTLGDMTDVLVCLNYHARDADIFAARYLVPVYCPPVALPGSI